MAAAVTGAAVLDGFDLYRAIGEFRTSAKNAKTIAMHRDYVASTTALQALVRAHLFGYRAPPAADATPAVRDTSLVLTGTIATADPATGFALIGPSKELAHLHPVGAAIATGVALRAVYPDRVIVDRDGRLATVYLPRGAGILAAIQHSPVAQPSADEAAEDDSTGSQQQEIEQSLEKESARTAAFLRQEPFYSQGQFRGIVIEPGTDPELLTKMGLKPGDVLHHVDGAMVVDSDRLDMLRERLASGRPVRVSVIRPGVGPVDITIDSHLVAAMIEN